MVPTFGNTRQASTLPDVILANGAAAGRAVAAGRPAACRSCLLIGSRPVRRWALWLVWRSRAAMPLGFIMFEFSISGKWVELLKRDAPNVTRVGSPQGSRLYPSGSPSSVLSNLSTPSFGVEVNPVNLVRDASEIEGVHRDLPRAPRYQWNVTTSPLTVAHRDLDRPALRPRAQTTRGLL